MLLYWGFVVFWIGACVGSYLPTIFYRKQHHMLMDWHSRSVCEYCGHVLGPLELIPILGYILLKGKSRCCQKPIPVKYPLIEFTFGLVSAGIVIFLAHL